MSSTRTIHEEHRALEARAAQLARIVASPVPDPAAVAAARWGIARALIDHGAREEREVHAQLLASGDTQAAAAARRFREDHGTFSRRFAHYLAGWPVALIAREWEAFRGDTLALLGELGQRIAVEEAELHPHLARVANRRVA